MADFEELRVSVAAGRGVAEAAGRAGGRGGGEAGAAARRRRGVRPVGGAASSGTAQGGTERARAGGWPRGGCRAPGGPGPADWLGGARAAAIAVAAWPPFTGEDRLRKRAVAFRNFPRPAVVEAGLSRAKAPSSHRRFLGVGRSALFWEHCLP